jgi:antitoxin MazE
MHTKIQKVQKWGNSLGVRIPKVFLNKIGVSEGFFVEINLEDNHLILTPQKTNLDALLAKITPENCHNEGFFGEGDNDAPQGKEVW